jgi:FtsP/CotA-like multicopper oxidase with cupredoxin domain
MTKRLSVFAALVLVLALAAWTSAGDVQITGTLKTTVQRFYGATGTNFLRVPDNAAAALVVEDHESGDNALTLVTTTSNERWLFERPIEGTRSTVAAAGTNQSTAQAIVAGAVWVTVTASDGVKGVRLPSGSFATCIQIMSQPTGASNTLLVYGHSSDNDTINGGAADAAYTQMAGTSLVYCTSDGVAWFTY